MQKEEMSLGTSLLTIPHPPLPSSSHSYIPVLMAQARIYWETEDYQQVVVHSACMHVCMCACVRACMHVFTCVHVCMSIFVLGFSQKPFANMSFSAMWYTIVITRGGYLLEHEESFCFNHTLHIQLAIFS